LSKSSPNKCDKEEFPAKQSKRRSQTKVSFNKNDAQKDMKTQYNTTVETNDSTYT
ncbi:hypothetical protein GBAR_LOCUS25762, partial [Geodia barretti]